MNIKGLLGKGALLAGITLGGVSLTTVAVEAGEVSHTVSKGETLNGIASQHNLTVSQLKDWNNIKDINVINVGQELELSGEDKEVKEDKGNKETVQSVEGKYTVKSGDTLFEIAVEHDIALGELKAWNNLTSDLIFVGQELIVDGSEVELVEEVSVEVEQGNNETVEYTEYEDNEEPAEEVVSYTQPTKTEETKTQPVEKASSVAPSQPTQSTSTASSNSSSSGQNWGALANCESGGDASVVSSNGLYHGLYQFDAQTWQSVGGSGVASDASAAEQTQRAQKLYEQRGSSPWPVCGANL